MSKDLIKFSLVIFYSTLIFAMQNFAQEIQKSPLLTKWANTVNADNVHPEYPRPQLVRDKWQNLNGMWEYAIRPKGEPKPEKFDGQILVPFPVESELSGVKKPVGPDNNLWYRRSFSVPDDWRDQQIRLNFGAVDWETKVWINGKEIGVHKGGYDPFSFDVTDALNRSGQQVVEIMVWDPVDKGTQPRGKQVENPRGIWYTSVTGIWQTVWLEPVNENHIRSLEILPFVDEEQVKIVVSAGSRRSRLLIEAIVSAEGNEIGRLEVPTRTPLAIPIKNAKLWSPQSPFLYDLKVILRDTERNIVDSVKSYFGMRKIFLGKDKDGFTRMLLNDEFVFQFGPLDQGWWPDGLYTAPSDEALRYDIEVTKKLGFNMARKHVKIEPARWYYWCDKLGLMVWQDMPSGDAYIDPNAADIQRSAESAAQFEREIGAMVNNLINHPSIVVWVAFNEGWGQFQTWRTVTNIKQDDPTRLVINASGWADRGVGDIHDIHAYPGPAMPEPEEFRAIVLGEFGGLGLPVEGHTWQDKDNWGYRQYNNAQELTNAYKELIKNLHLLILKGLSAAVYTQTTDVEIEVNGLMTYDRALIKMDVEQVKRINQGYFPPIISSKNEIFLDEETVDLLNVTQSGEIRYTVDGSEPNKSSELYTNPLTISKTTTVKARTYWPDGTYSTVGERTINQVTLKKAVQIPGLKPGLQYNYYEDKEEKWSKIPDLKLLNPTSSGIAAECNLKLSARNDFFAMSFVGFIKIAKDGVYTFYSNSDDGSRLFISSQKVVDNDFNHPMTEKSGQIALKAGTHLFELHYYQGRGGKGLEVSYEGPGMAKQTIPADVLFHTE